MRRRMDFLLEKLLCLIRKNKLLTKIAEKILLIPTVRRGLDKVFQFDAILRREREHCFVAVSSKNLLDIKRILDKAGIRFWLMFGTFLGAYRDQAIIPYDGDTDLAIYAEDLSGLARCIYAFVEKGFELRVGPDMAAVYQAGILRDGQRTGIAIFKLDGSKRVWKSIKYDISAFETFNEVQFLGQKWRILSEPERWLRYTYGEDWRTPIKGKGVGLGYAYGEESEST